MSWPRHVVTCDACHGYGLACDGKRSTATQACKKCGGLGYVCEKCGHAVDRCGCTFIISKPMPVEFIRAGERLMQKRKDHAT